MRRWCAKGSEKFCKVPSFRCPAWAILLARRAVGCRQGSARRTRAPARLNRGIFRILVESCNWRSGTYLPRPAQDVNSLGDIHVVPSVRSPLEPVDQIRLALVPVRVDADHLGIANCKNISMAPTCVVHTHVEPTNDQALNALERIDVISGRLCVHFLGSVLSGLLRFLDCREVGGVDCRLDISSVSVSRRPGAVVRLHS